MKGRPISTLRLSHPVPAGTRLPPLDALKGLAMALVIAYHVGGVLGAPNLLHGEVGVDIFLLVSGILLAVNSYHVPTGEFFKRRFLRIYPSYWIALLLLLWLNSKYYADNRPAADIWLHLAGLQGLSLPAYFSSVSDPFWFITIIVMLYAGFICLRTRLHDIVFVAGVGGLVTTVVWIFYQRTNSAGGLAHLGCRIPTAFLGLILGQIASGRPTEIRLGLVGAVGLAALAWSCLYNQLSLDYSLTGLAWAAAFLTADRWLRRRHPGRVLLEGFGLLGIYSYEIYLLHQPFIRDYNQLFLFDWFHILHPKGPVLWASMAVAFALVVAASVVLHKATEALFKYLRRPASAQAA